MKDFSKLRPFDLEAAKAGELLTGYKPIFEGKPVCGS